MRTPQRQEWKYEANERLWRSYVRFLKLKNRSEQTIINYRKSVFRLDQSVLFTEATRLDLEEFFEVELSRVSVNSVNNAYRSLRAFYGWLLKEKFISSSPLANVSIPESELEDPRVLTDQELRELLKACKGTSFIDRRDTAIVRLMSEIGSPRLGEMHSLTTKHVDWRNEAIHVTGKTGSRWIPYGTKSADALEKYLRLRTTHKYNGLDALWLCNQGQLGYYSFRAMLHRRCRKAGITPISNHILRHTSASRAMEAEISGDSMQVLFGWSSNAMVSVYGRATRTQRALASARSKAIGDRI